MVNLHNHKPSRIWQFLAEESGPTTVEYAVLLALITAVIVLSVNAVGTNASNVFQNIGDELSGGMGGMGMGGMGMGGMGM